jgi:hypothetical protein
MDAAEGRDADDPDADGLGDQHRGRIAHAQPAVLGGAAIDHDFVIGPRRPPAHDPPRVELWIGDPVARASRRAVATGPFAVLANELAVALDRRLGDGDTRDGADAIHERR